MVGPKKAQKGTESIQRDWDLRATLQVLFLQVSYFILFLVVFFNQVFTSLQVFQPDNKKGTPLLSSPPYKCHNLLPSTVHRMKMGSNTDGKGTKPTAMSTRQATDTTRAPIEPSGPARNDARDD